MQQAARANLGRFAQFAGKAFLLMVKVDLCFVGSWWLACSI
jgi:hypothetical protein